MVGGDRWRCARLVAVSATTLLAVSLMTVEPASASGDSAPTPRLTLTGSTTSLTAKADASRSRDTDSTPIASYTFDFGDSSSPVKTSSSRQRHTYASPGTYSVTLTVKDTGGLVSFPKTRRVTVGPPPPPDSAPIARLTTTGSTSSLTATADASDSTDTDATPIESYTFDFGDSTSPETTSASSRQHTYPSAGTYTVTLTVTDTANLVSDPVEESVTVSKTSGAGIAVFAGYYDTHHDSSSTPKPSPWQGSSGVVFVGEADSSSGGWDTSAVRVDNLTGAPMTGVVVTVDIGSHRFALWGTHTIPAGQSLIVAQMGNATFDGSDRNPAGCYDCDPDLCDTDVSSTIPVVNLTYNGITAHISDPDQILNTNGVDSAGCPYTGNRNDETEPWQQIN
jgi:PKD repeat protein